jgi:ribosomal protein S18 acetylase RimI-like enzyme
MELVPGFTWRSLGDADILAVAQLAALCQSVDGGLPSLATEAFLRERYWSAEPRAALGGYDAEGQLVASTLIQRETTEQEYRVTAIGQVHPDYCGRGLGAALIAWSESQADGLLVGCLHDRPAVFRVATESLTDEAAHLFARFGLVQKFGEWVMRYDLRLSLPVAPLPSDLTVQTWTPTRAEAFFEAYEASFRERPGFPGWSAQTWIGWASDDPDFRPELSLLVCRDELPVGFILCSDNYVSQIGVRPEWRRQGIASALLVETLSRLQTEGQSEVWLTVAENNPTAIQTYRTFGFETRGRRARFERAGIAGHKVVGHEEEK